MIAARCDELLHPGSGSTGEFVALHERILTKFRKKFDAAEQAWRAYVEKDGGAAGPTAQRFERFRSGLKAGPDITPGYCENLKVELGICAASDWLYINAKPDYAVAIRTRTLQ